VMASSSDMIAIIRVFPEACKDNRDRTFRYG
jgi:hypothetical protein